MTFAEAVAKAVVDTIKEWAAIKKKQERNQKAAARMEEQLSRGRDRRITVKEAAFQMIPDAYHKASGDGEYPANARQIMYAARPEIQRLTGQVLNDTYFTQVLLPAYIQEHPEQTEDWDVVYDARGHLWEPHTGREISLGTLGVREYLDAMQPPELADLVFELPELNREFPSKGPANRYGAILYVEKEGFLPLLEQVGLAERYDMAIMSSKGMGTTAVRTLIEDLSGQVKILALHDFDKSGFSILGTLTRDTRRYTYTKEPDVLDLGLRLEDVEGRGLESEEVIHPTDPADNLELNGATPEEVAFLRGQLLPDGRYHGRRVELNAFTSDEFVNWLESKLEEHGISKVIPDAATLEYAYRRAAGLRRFRAILKNALHEVKRYASTLQVPDELGDCVKEELSKEPGQSWDQVIENLLPQDREEG